MTISKSEEASIAKKNCLLHPSGTHKTEDYQLFLDKKAKERADIVEDNRACSNCLVAGHTFRTCRTRKFCSKADSGENHQLLLHDDNFLTKGNKKKFSSKYDVSNTSQNSLLQVMHIEVRSGSNKPDVLALLDSGSTVSLILNRVANNLMLKGKHVSNTLYTLDRVVKKSMNLFVKQIKERKNKLVQIDDYGVVRISRDMPNTELQKHLFPENFHCQASQKTHIGLLLGFERCSVSSCTCERKEYFCLV